MKLSDVQQISNVDITRMNEKELKQIANVLFPAVNKRIQRLEKSGYGESPALKGLKKSQGVENPKFKISNSKSRNQLMSQIISAQNFVKSKTGSVSKIKGLEKDFFNKYGGKGDIDTSQMWEEYRKFEEENAGLVNRLSSDFVVSNLTKIFKSAELKDKFLTDNEYREQFAGSIEGYIESMGLEPEDSFKDLI